MSLIKEKNSEKQLTAKQEHFCQLIAQGKTQVFAYTKAYNSKASKKVRTNKASEEAKKPHIKQRIKEIRNEMALNFDMLEFFTELNEVIGNERGRPDEGFNARFNGNVIKALELKAKAVGIFEHAKQINVSNKAQEEAEKSATPTAINIIIDNGLDDEE